MSSSCDRGNHRDQIIEMVEAAGNEAGKTVYQCNVCGRVYAEVMDQADHIWSEWMMDREADCETEGLRYRVCEVGNTHVEQEVIPALGHVYEEKDEGVFTCRRCGSSYETTRIQVKETELPQEQTEEVVLEQTAPPLFNTVDIVITVVNINLILFFVLFILVDRKAILWDKRKRKELAERKKQERLEIQEYGFHQ